jgi:tRNA threonylcarbamoyladenosine biosynthesis protein TsaB
VKPILLAVDTTHEFGSLALTCGDDIVEEVALHAPDGFAHVIYQHLGSLLERQNIRIQAIDCFASASGPGSFTGVRVGLACIKGLAESCGKPAIAVSNLQAIASYGNGMVRAPLLDARRNQVYAGLYDSSGTPLAAEVVANFQEWLDSLPEGEMEFISMDFAPFEAAFRASRFANARCLVAPNSLAAAIARIASARFRNGERPDTASLDANYVRRPDAELYWKE